MEQEYINMPQLPQIGFLRLPQIIGDRKRNIPPLIPISRSAWWLGIRNQKYPKGNPGMQINHALVLGGNQGIGKDFMLTPLRYGVGAANAETVEYKDLLDTYNPWAERTLIVVNEARNSGGVDRYDFYERSKRLIAAPPDMISCRKMYQGAYSVPNVMAVVITSNNKLSGLYIEPGDRRHYVAWSKAEKAPDSYFEALLVMDAHRRRSGGHGGLSEALGYTRLQAYGRPAED